MNETAMRTKRALQALRAADQRGMGRVAGGMGATATDRLSDLDACTRAYRSWHPALVPGPLQTDSYTASAIMSRTPSLDMGELEKRTAHRRRRAASFLGHRSTLPGTFAWFVLGEAAIARPITSLVSHAEQLQQLLNIGRDYDNVIIQVLREDLPQPGTAEPFDIHHLDPGPVLGHLESLVGSWYTVTSEDVARLMSAFSDLTNQAMTATASRQYISEVLDTCWGRSREQNSSSPVTATPGAVSTSPDLPTGLSE